MAFLARTCNYDAMGGERLAARLFVALGGIFWIIAGIAGATLYTNTAFATAAGEALLPFVLAGLALLIGWFYENLAAVLLFLGVVAEIVWGIVAGWEAGVWGLMAFVLIGPTLLAGLLFLMAAQMQRVCAVDVSKGG